MKILIADDHHLIIEGLKAALQNAFPEAEINGAINKLQLFENLEKGKTDILIQDIKFGESNAKDFLDDLKTVHPELKIIFLTSVSDSVTIKQLSKKVDGYILKSESQDEIIAAIEALIKGDKYFSAEASERMKEFPEEEFFLSRREQEVLAVIMQEKSIREIAEELCISEKTVEMHRSNLFVKLDVKNITGLIKKAIALNLIAD
ncbi:MAG: response regulator transcription factor [Bacteroidia bacterium]